VIFKNGHQEKYKKLVSTIPLRDFLSLIINETSTNLSNTSKYLKCTSVVNFNLGFNKEEISPYHWIYFPEKKYPFYRLGFWNNISSLLVPDNTGALYGEYSYRADTKNLKTINKNVSKSIEQVLYLFGLKEKNIIVKKNLDINCAYVIYDQWRERNIKKILNILAQHSVYSIGRYGAWKYASMQEAVLDGYDVVKRLIK
jgi:UDP-galactopyranose mutase